MKRWSALSSAASNFRCQTCALAVTQEETSWTRRQHRGGTAQPAGVTRPAAARRRCWIVAHNSQFLLHDILEGLWGPLHFHFWVGWKQIDCCRRRPFQPILVWPPEKWLSPTDFRGLRKNLGLNQNFKIFGNFGKWPHGGTCLAPWPWQWFLGMWKAKNIHFQQQHA